MELRTNTIASRAVVLTQRESLARQLQITYSLEQKNTGQSVWERPAIASFRRWALTAWESCWPETQLLHPVQEMALFKSVIDQSETAQPLLSTTAAARLARKAAVIMTAYRIDADDPQFDFSPETASFKVWLSKARAKQKANGWITEDLALEELIAFVRCGRFQAPGEILLQNGFLATPQQRALLEALAEAGTSIRELPHPRPVVGQQSFIRSPNPEMEVREAVALVREWLSGGDDQSWPRIAILVSDLEAARVRLEPVLIDVLTPTHRLPSTEERAYPWRYGRGRPLSEHDAIRAALSGLELCMFDNPSDLVSRFLLTRRFGNDDETNARAEIDRTLRETEGRRVGLHSLTYLAGRPGSTYAPEFVRRLEALMESLATDDGKALPSSWAERYRTRLQALGWPGRGLASAAYQAVKVFEECLAVLASMDRQLGDISPVRAFAWLREIVSTREHQPRLPYTQPIQILEWKDAAGLVFDRVIVLGCDSTALPAPAARNPFIPLELQRSHGVAGATTELALEEARRLVDALAATGTQVVWSCPLRQDDGVDLVPTPLVEGWPSQETPSRQLNTLRETIVAQGIQVAVPAEDPVPPVRDFEAEGIRGGISVLSNFAVMPFAAFARNRLGLRALAVPSAGLDAPTQGNAVHAVLEQIWGAIGGLEQLLAMEEKDLDRTIEQIVGSVLADGGKHQWRFGPRLMELERRRVARLAKEWMTLERRRTDRFTVVARELQARAVISGISFPVRIDRIDRVSTNAGERFLIIDYKSGASVSPYEWSPAVLTEPQLPAYATSVDLSAQSIDKIHGIAFGHVTAGGCKYYVNSEWAAGLTGEESKKPLGSWSSLLADWRAELDSSMLRFLAGDARADVVASRQNPLFRDLAVFLRQCDGVV